MRKAPLPVLTRTSQGLHALQINLHQASGCQGLIKCLLVSTVVGDSMFLGS
jgi:hypothetical protein